MKTFFLILLSSISYVMGASPVAFAPRMNYDTTGTNTTWAKWGQASSLTDTNFTFNGSIIVEDNTTVGGQLVSEDKIFITDGALTNVVMLLQPNVADGSVAYFLNTSETHSSGDLFQISNNGNSVFLLSYLGGLSVGTKAGQYGDGSEVNPGFHSTAIKSLDGQTANDLTLQSWWNEAEAAIPANYSAIDIASFPPSGLGSDDAFATLAIDAYASGETTPSPTGFEVDSRPGDVYVYGYNASSTLFELHPTVSDGLTPYVYDTSIPHTSGNLIELKNGGTLAISLNSGNLLEISGVDTDSGFSVSAPTDEFLDLNPGFIDLGGPGNGYAMISPYQSDGSAVMTISSDITHTSGNLVEIKNNGTDAYRFLFSGQVLINGIEPEIYGETPNGSAIDLYAQNGDEKLQLLNTGGVQVTRLHPTSAVSETAYVFDTGVTHTSGNLAEIKNNGTTEFTVDYNGIANATAFATSNGSDSSQMSPGQFQTIISSGSSNNIINGFSTRFRIYNNAGAYPYVDLDPTTADSSTTPAYAFHAQDTWTGTNIITGFYNVGNLPVLAVTANGIRTAVPAGATNSLPFRFGQIANGVVTLDTAHYVQADINGTAVKLLVAP